MIIHRMALGTAGADSKGSRIASFKASKVSRKHKNVLDYPHKSHSLGAPSLIAPVITKGVRVPGGGG